MNRPLVERGYFFPKQRACSQATWYKTECAFKSASKAWYRAPLITFFCFNQKKYLYQLVSVGDGYLYETIIYFLRQKIARGFCNSFSVCKASSAVSAYRTSLSSLASWQVRSSKNVEESKYERLVITW